MALVHKGLTHKKMAAASKPIIPKPDKPERKFMSRDQVIEEDKREAAIKADLIKAEADIRAKHSKSTGTSDDGKDVQASDQAEDVGKVSGPGLVKGKAKKSKAV